MDSPRPTRRRSARYRPLLFAAPALAFYVVFYLAPTIAGAGYAFTDWNGITAPSFVGLDNFFRFGALSQVREATINTLVITVVTVLVINVVGLVLAFALNARIRTRNVLRTIVLLPSVLSAIVAAYLWQFIFTPNGVLNGFLGMLGLDSWQRPWLGDPATALWAVVVVIIWQGLGLTVTLYLAGLQGIPPELHEAMQVDGASPRQRMIHLSVPLIAPAVTVNVLLLTVGGLNTFGQVFAMTGGGPGYATETIGTLIYKQVTITGEMGFAAAMSLTLALFVFAIIGLQFYYLRRREAVMGK